MEINKKNISNPALKAAIEKMQEDNSQENVNKMIDCIMSAKLITPGTMSKPRNVAHNDGRGGTVMQQQAQVQFQLIENGKKEKYFPAFTDRGEMKNWENAQGKQEMLMTFDDYAGVLSDPQSKIMGFVVNPFGKSVAFPKPMVMSLKQQKDDRQSQGGLRQQTISADENVEIGDPNPDEYPIDMMAAIINCLNERDDVRSAYLRMFRRDEKADESYLVIVDFEGDKMEEIFSQISAAASPHLGGYQLSMMPYSLPFAKKAAQGVEPFFEA